MKMSVFNLLLSTVTYSFSVLSFNLPPVFTFVRIHFAFITSFPERLLNLEFLFFFCLFSFTFLQLREHQIDNQASMKYIFIFFPLLLLISDYNWVIKTTSKKNKKKAKKEAAEVKEEDEGKTFFPLTSWSIN